VEGKISVVKVLHSVA